MKSVSTVSIAFLVGSASLITGCGKVEFGSTALETSALSLAGNESAKSDAGNTSIRSPNQAPPAVGSSTGSVTQAQIPNRTPEAPPLSGKHAFFGLWDDGDVFGGDPFMCGETKRASRTSPDPSAYFNPQIGCEVRTSLCASGVAVAARHFEIRWGLSSNATESDLAELARELGTSVADVSANVFRAWDYRCTEPIAQPQPQPEPPLSSGHVFYGVWDFGDAFGNDHMMCASSPGALAYTSPGVGCEVPAARCASGRAVAVAYYDLNAFGSRTASDAVVASVAAEMNSSPSEVLKSMVRVWDYHCKR